MKKMIERIMIIRRIFGVILLFKSKLVFDLRGINGGGGGEEEIKFLFMFSEKKKSRL